MGIYDEIEEIKQRKNENQKIKDKTMKNEGMVSSIFPFKRKKSLKVIPTGVVASPLIKNKEELKEPIAIIIKPDFAIKIKQNVKEGYLTVEREIGEKREDVKIFLPNAKLMSFPVDKEGKTIRGWIVDVKNAVALPSETEHDSIELKRIFDALILNYKSFDSSGIKSKWILYIVGAIVAIFFISAILGMPIQEMIFGKPVVQTVVQYVDSNAGTIIGLIKPW